MNPDKDVAALRALVRQLSWRIAQLEEQLLESRLVARVQALEDMSHEHPPYEGS
jgi:hypothetical protein